MNEPSASDLATGHGPARNTAFSLLTQILSAVFTLALTLFLVRALGPADYGILALAVSVGTLLLFVSDPGISASAARFAAERPHSRLHAAAVLRSALWMTGTAAVVSAVALALLAPTIASAYDTPALTLPLQLVAIGVAAQAIGGVFLAWFTALGRVSLTLRYGILESSVETGASICLVLLGGGTAGAAGGRTLGFAVAGVLAAFLAIRIVGWQALRNRGEHGFPARKIAGYGAALLIVDSAFALFDRADVLIIGAMLDPTAAGTFEAAVRIITFLWYPAIAVGAGFAPRLAAGRRETVDSDRFIQAVRYTLLLYLLVAAPVLVWATPVVNLTLGADYDEAAGVLRALAPAVAIGGIAPALAAAANYLGEARSRVPLAIGALGLNIVLDLILIPGIGIIAGAVSTSVAFALYTAGHVRICNRALGIPFTHLLPTAARGLAAFAAAALVLFAFGTDTLSLFAWIAAPPLATAAFLAVLLALRELTVDEMRAIPRLAGRLLPERTA